VAGEIPERGLLVLHGDNPTVRALGAKTAGRTYTYGLTPHQNDVAATDVVTNEEGQQFSLQIDGRPVSDLRIPMFGRHNLLNALAATSVALDEGLSVDQIQEGLATFPGVKRRHQLLAEIDGIKVVDDFAHHPTAVRSTIEASRQRWEDQRIVAVFQPRSNSSRRKIFESRYANALSYADRVFLSVPPFRHNDHPDRFLDADRLIDMLGQSDTKATAY
jgi:UDP-N-acetylmuramate: L-alanyl-gamma-D-glutamyl-meso-diaminopimelate ligase